MAYPISDDFKYGFRRPEMYTAPISDTVDAYDRHVFLCYGTPKSWPANVEDSQLHLLPRALSSALKSRQSQIPGKTRLTLCEGEKGGESFNGDILIFPDMIKCRGLTHLDVDNFIDDVFIRGSKRVSESLTGSHIFVCCHQNRDKRCGHCGPILVEKFIEEIELRGMKNEVFVSPCSHLGGHQYAGNLIIFGPGFESKCEGHWYGYVTPDDVPCLLDEHIGKGKIVERLWRGHMNLSNNKEKKVEEETANGNSVGYANRALGCCSNDPSNCCMNKNKDDNIDEGQFSTKNTRRGHKTKGLGRL